MHESFVGSHYPEMLEILFHVTNGICFRVWILRTISVAVYEIINIKIVPYSSFLSISEMGSVDSARFNSHEIKQEQP